MAVRRMFAQSVIESDLFLDMPAAAQMLYIHLCMNADDDGFNDKVKMIQRMVGATAKDLNLLIEQEFLISFPSGVCVIRHWKVSNYIAKDRYRKTVYQDEKSTLVLDEETKIYTISTCDDNNSDTECNHNDDIAYTDCIQNGDVGKGRLGEVKLGEGRVNTITSIAPAPAVPVAPAPRNHFSQEFDTVWEKYPRREGKKKARDAFIKARKEGVSLDDIVKGVEAYAEKIRRDKTETQYIAHGSTWFNQRRWEDDYSAKEGMNYAGDGYDPWEHVGIVI